MKKILNWIKEFWFLIVIAILIINQSITIEPIEININQDNVRFVWSGPYGSYKIYIDEHKEFTSPIIANVVGKSYKTQLEPGTYYWKISKGDVESKTANFTFESLVGLSMNELNDNYRIKNVGNTKVNVSIEEKRGWSPIGAVVLEVNQSMKVKKDVKVTGEGL